MSFNQLMCPCWLQWFIIRQIVTEVFCFLLLLVPDHLFNSYLKTLSLVLNKSIITFFHPPLFPIQHPVFPPHPSLRLQAGNMNYLTGSRRSAWLTAVMNTRDGWRETERDESVSSPPSLTPSPPSLEAFHSFKQLYNKELPPVVLLV